MGKCRMHLGCFGMAGHRRFSQSAQITDDAFRQRSRKASVARFAPIVFPALLSTYTEENTDLGHRRKQNNADKRFNDPRGKTSTPNLLSALVLRSSVAFLLLSLETTDVSAYAICRILLLSRTPTPRSSRQLY